MCSTYVHVCIYIYMYTNNIVLLVEKRQFMIWLNITDHTRSEVTVTTLTTGQVEHDLFKSLSSIISSRNHFTVRLQLGPKTFHGSSVSMDKI